MGDEPLKDQGRPFRSVVCFMVTFHCTPSLITCITWTYCMHPVQGAIAPRGWDLCISPPQPWIQLFNRNTKLPHCVQQGYPSYSQCLPNFEHEFQCWLNDFTYTRNRGHLRQTKKVAMCIDRLLPCLKVFIYGKWWFSTCFFTRKKSWWVLGGFWVGCQAPHLQVLFLLTLDCQWSSRHAFCCCMWCWSMTIRVRWQKLLHNFGALFTPLGQWIWAKCYTHQSSRPLPECWMHQKRYIT